MTEFLWLTLLGGVIMVVGMWVGAWLVWSSDERRRKTRWRRYAAQTTTYIERSPK